MVLTEQNPRPPVESGKRQNGSDGMADDYILWPESLPDRTRMGGKAAALAELNGVGTIPAWFVITPTVLERLASDADEAVNAITNALTRLDNAPDARFAVRSSATAEDGTTVSFAGQLASYLNVKATDVIDHVQAVRQSAFTDHVEAYRQIMDDNGVNNHEQSPWLPAVLVQRMVKADVAGVAFGADPVTGDNSICTITAVAGLGDKLVGGLVNGDTYQTDRSGDMVTQTLVAGQPLLSSVQIREIAALVNRVEAQMGTPQDIEWAFAEQQLYLLQARPITTLAAPSLPERVEDEGESTSNSSLTIWDNSNIVESYSGVTSPLTFSFARHVYEHVYMEFCKLMGVSQAKIERERDAFQNMLGHINGHVYYNLLNWYRVLALFPGFQMNRRFMEQMMGVKEPLPDELLDAVAPQQTTHWAKFVDAVQLARAGFGLIGAQLLLARTSSRFYQRLNAALTVPPAQLQELSLAELATEYRKVEQKLLTQWDAPLINDFLCMIAFGLSRKLLERQAGEIGLQLHSELLIGQGDIISAEPARRMRAMATLAAQDETVVAALADGTIEEATAAINSLPELVTAYHAYLTKFGNRCLQELKLESPTLHDDPSTLLRAIGQMAHRLTITESPRLPEQAPSPSIQAQLAPLFPNQPFRRWMTAAVVRWAKARVRDRENLRFERTRVFGHARQLFLAMGQRLHEQQRLENPRDIFFLEVGEVMTMADGATTVGEFSAAVAERKSQQAHFATLSAPPNRIEGDKATFTQSPRHESTETDRLTRKGIGCCAGIVCAPVRVIEDPRNATLAPGEIMVARFTDPGWITLFANAAGILVERGSLLSHSAIVARELGIPAVVAIDGVMEWLKTGDTVEMDGATGVVRKM